MPKSAPLAIRSAPFRNGPIGRRPMWKNVLNVCFCLHLFGWVGFVLRSTASANELLARFAIFFNTAHSYARLDLSAYTTSTSPSIRSTIWPRNHRIPFYMSTDCENLLRKFLVLNPTKRSSLEAIMHDKWMNMGYELEDELKPYIEPKADLKDPKRIGKTGTVFKFLFTNFRPFHTNRPTFTPPKPRFICE